MFEDVYEIENRNTSVSCHFISWALVHRYSPFGSPEIWLYHIHSHEMESNGDLEGDYCWPLLMGRQDVCVG